MSMNQMKSQTRFNQINNNEIFSQHIGSYIPLIDELSQLPSPAIEEEVLTDYFISKYGLTLEQINHDLAICRELEGV